MSCYCHLYEDEPWARLAKEAGFEPCHTESAARDAFAFAATLLEELEALCDYAEKGYWPGTDPVQRARAAIAKARGRP